MSQNNGRQVGFYCGISWQALGLEASSVKLDHKTTWRIQDSGCRMGPGWGLVSTSLKGCNSYWWAWEPGWGSGLGWTGSGTLGMSVCWRMELVGWVRLQCPIIHRSQWDVRQTELVHCTCWQAQEPELGSQGPVQWGLLGFTLTGLQIPLWYIKAEHVLGRDGLAAASISLVRIEVKNKLINYPIET